MRYTSHDLETALDFTRMLYAPVDAEDCVGRTMVELLRIVGAERIIYGEFDVERQVARLEMQPSIVKEQDGTVGGRVNGALSSLEAGFSHHPLFRYFLQVGDGRPQKATQVMTRSQHLAYCHDDEFARQLGAKYQIGMFFAVRPNIVAVILLTQSRRRFTQRTWALAHCLYPHLLNVYTTLASRSRARRDVDDLVALLEGPTSSVIVLAGTGEVRRWTAQAQQWIRQYCRTPFPTEADRLPDCFAQWYRRQLALAGQAQQVPFAFEPLVAEHDGRQLTVQFIPDDLRDEHLLLLNERQLTTSWAALEPYSLTPRESEVLGWVAKGKTNGEVGMILQMSGRTVQKRLEHIYAKLGVESRATATLKMLGVGDT